MPGLWCYADSAEPSANGRRRERRDAMGAVGPGQEAVSVMAPPSLPPIVIDRREQTPWVFSPSAQTVPGTLRTGDYSIEGFTDSITIERKSGEDFVSSLTWGRERFDRELERMQAIRWRAIIVEAPLRAVLGGMGTRAHWSGLLGSIAAIVADGIPILFADGPLMAAAVAERMLTKMHKRALAARTEQAA